jgi:hypothetical protein
LLGEAENDLQINGIPLRFGELSEGYRSLVALLGHMLSCLLKVCQWNNDPTGLNGIALIDELDLHLHPTWQSHVVEDFRRAFRNVQLIASTHAPLVVGALKREDVYIMQKDADGSTLICRPEIDPQGLGVAGVLTSIFDLDSTIDQPTLNKITRRIYLFSKRDTWSPQEEGEYEELTDDLAGLGFNREFSDPYFERFATAIARHHRATIKKLTPQRRRELDEYADRLLAELLGQQR